METRGSVTWLISQLRAQATPGDYPNMEIWALEQMDATEPTPAEAMILNEALKRRLDALSDPQLRQIAR